MEDDEPNVVEPFGDFMFLGPSCAENQTGESSDMDAGHQFVSVEPTSKRDLQFLPIQLVHRFGQTKVPCKKESQIPEIYTTFCCQQLKYINFLDATTILVVSFNIF